MVIDFLQSYSLFKINLLFFLEFIKYEKKKERNKYIENNKNGFIFIFRNIRRQREVIILNDMLLLLNVVEF